MFSAIKRLVETRFSADISARPTPPEAEWNTGTDRIVHRDVNLLDRSQVEQHLPGILGKALARAWIDKEFAQALVANPKVLLHSHGVSLPDTIRIETEVDPEQRKRIIVYDWSVPGQPQRLLYLQLIMMAGR